MRLMAEQILKVKREGDFHYPIYFEDNFEQLADALRKEKLDGRTICIVTDTNVAPLYAEEVKRILSGVSDRVFLFCFEAGEANKNLDTVQKLYEALILNKMDRKGLLAALGGGVVGDLAGFCVESILYRFRLHFWLRSTAVWAEKQGWIFSSIKTWWALFINRVLYI